jgi:predicted dinucleotide-binding enzyme
LAGDRCTLSAPTCRRFERHAARHFVAAGHQVYIGGSGELTKLNATMQDVGATSSSVPDAIDGSEFVMLAIPWVARQSVFTQAGAGTGRIVLDAMNPYKMHTSGG